MFPIVLLNLIYSTVCGLPFPFARSSHKGENAARLFFSHTSLPLRPIRLGKWGNVRKLRPIGFMARLIRPPIAWNMKLFSVVIIVIKRRFLPYQLKKRDFLRLLNEPIVCRMAWNRLPSCHTILYWSPLRVLWLFCLAVPWHHSRTAIPTWFLMFLEVFSFFLLNKKVLLATQNERICVSYSMIS